MKIILELKNISKKINGKKILDNSSFKVNQGAIVGFLGNNGSGKTMLMKLIFGEIKKDFGEILYFGNSIFLNNFLQEISFFPDLNNINLNFTVKEYLFYIEKLLNKKCVTIF
ncbi:ATP-binding cassette domain-containing protein [Spiroplasma taiwanense]|uniref:ABC transporter domain-containing protein n=1 Tax=Spiroplasma taiwanense CT-1 TaxID=1276220 RepID=S5MG10_9MOLU|nr:ATP-binding cassette domain-containing protein [Spiroplasma taiwanense]AGR40800.1 hypothetical protein STAIW_v1c01140 [Spiroplasma taiwanense CT-1]